MSAPSWLTKKTPGAASTTEIPAWIRETVVTRAGVTLAGWSVRALILHGWRCCCITVAVCCWARMATISRTSTRRRRHDRA
jgi:hypothetical protein